MKKKLIIIIPIIIAVVAFIFVYRYYNKEDATTTLTVREKEVFLEILKNKKRKAIAEELCVTESTVKKHTSHIFAKLGVSSRVELFEKLNQNII